MATTTTGERSPRWIGRQMAVGFGAVSVVALAMCGMLLSIIYDVSGLIASMRHEETSIRQGLDLATSVRELSNRIAHALIDNDEVHVGRYTDSRERVRVQIQQLSSHVPESEHVRLQALGERTQRMHDLVISTALPAARRGETEELRRVHRELEALGGEAAQLADALAHATSSHMAHAHVLATDSTRLGLIGGGLCALLIIGLSVGFTLRLRASVFGELAALGDAFDRMADELTRREARLLENERMAAIGQLAAGVAHELNNPIGIIRGYLKTMSPDEEADTLREELSILDEEAGHCQRIADDLLAYARTGELSVDRVEMGAFLRETAKRFESTATPSGTHVEVDADDVAIEADSARLRQVMLNLLLNAGQASPAGASVKLRGKRTHDAFQIEIEDSGTGVAQEDRSRIFEPFFSKRRGGSGLGLAVCLGIVKAHGGSIEVVDGASGGALFRVRLPLTSPASEKESAHA